VALAIESERLVAVTVKTPGAAELNRPPVEIVPPLEDQLTPVPVIEGPAA
jgi:hypothetical protein